ncbi:MAG: hemin uptake protein HemP [Metallibacterium scheffleri]|uniref:hemin uptake protein HemP n=1 Tax=Metallibacterium scheffleri TaxID=993689 RepID=UPI0026ED35E6|nr:hemin uptake protein HemP [Metallibacterium scheffleri]MCK9367723.1 hemin uptake protein HemP [Metallibacterium scheffleri]
MLPHTPPLTSHLASVVRTPAPTAPQRARQIDSHQLLAGARELAIEHLGQTYHLRLTRNDKLILTK